MSLQRKKSLSWELRYVDPPSSSNEEAGFVKGLVTYMVMDDLVVMPLSAISGITRVKDVEGVEEKVVDLGLDEVYIYQMLHLVYSCLTCASFAAISFLICCLNKFFYA